MSMEKILYDALLDLGCNQKEAKFFITNYKLGPSSINNITKAARLERSTAYLLSEKLIAKGLILEDHKRYKKVLMTIEPKTLLRMIAAKQRQIGRHELALEEHLPELQSLYQASEIRPQVRTYEGNKGLLSIWQDILAVSQEVYLWTNQETESNFFSKEYHQLFIKERLRKAIPLKVLAVDNKKGRALLKKDHTALRETRLLPQKKTFSAETYIYGNKITVLDYHKDIIGVIIESEQIAQAQRTIFEIAWDNAA